MNSTIWRFIIYSEIAAAILLTVGIAQSYGRVVPLTCPRSRSAPTPSMRAEYSVRPMPQIGASKTTWKPSTASVTRVTGGNVGSTHGRGIAMTGYATWYSRKSSGKTMSTGKPLDDNAMTCALWITNSAGCVLRPDGRKVIVVGVLTGKKVVVRWTDNGPGPVPRSRGVVCDLTPAAMRALAGEGGIRAGRVKVRIETI